MARDGIQRSTWWYTKSLLHMVHPLGLPNKRHKSKVTSKYSPRAVTITPAYFRLSPAKASVPDDFFA
jgi:hypothetical protein